MSASGSTRWHHERVSSDYDPSVILYRRARLGLDEAKTAAWRQSAGSVHARAEEVDEVVLTVVLVHAALETAWHWATRSLSTQEKGRWPRDWNKTLLTAATKRGVSSVAAPDDLGAALLELGALRNFLQHGDDQARKKLAGMLPDFSVPESLNFAFADQVVKNADRLFQRFADMAGGEAVGPDHSGWTPDPYRAWGD